MQEIENLWLRIRFSRWFLQLPQELQEPPGLYGLAAGAALLLLGILWLTTRTVQGWFSGSGVREERQQLRREIRRCRKSGDWRGVGERLQALGKDRQAVEAYRRGGAHAEAVALLLEKGNRVQAKQVALEGKVWLVYGEMAEEDGEPGEAASAFEHAGRPFAAARCFEKAGLLEEAARAYQEAGMTSRAIEILCELSGPEAAESLDATLRKHWSGLPSLDPETATAVRHGAQLWLQEKEPRKAFDLVVDMEQWQLAVPIARDHLPPSEETAEVCRRAGALAVAADLYGKLGDPRNEALAQAERFEQQENAPEAARWYETAEEWAAAAEQWAVAGESSKAAELYAKAGDFQQAAQLYQQTGRPEEQQEMLRHLNQLESQLGSQLLDAPDGEATRIDPVATAGPPTRTNPPPEPAPSVAPTPPPAPETQDRYRLLEEIGRGGMGVVYQAEDRLLERPVAYKVLPRSLLSNAEAVESLLAEARAAARLSHANIVQVYDAGYRDDGFFIVMELIRGQTFAELLSSKRFSLRGALQVGRQICSALDHAHRRRIVHRDLKPSNLLWTDERRVKLTDFGLARAIDETTEQILTRPAGTPLYMAPEQIRGEPVDPRTDLYSLGCVLFEILCGESPFEGRAILQRLEKPPTDPRTLRPDLPEPLVALLLACLARDPASRPPSAAAVAKALVEVGRMVDSSHHDRSQAE